MTEYKAISGLETLTYQCKYKYECGTCNICNSAVPSAIEALEKQIPKKIVNYNKISAAGNCPACMKFIDSCDEYCRYCGQALKEDEE